MSSSGAKGFALDLAQLGAELPLGGGFAGLALPQLGQFTQLPNVGGVGPSWWNAVTSPPLLIAPGGVIVGLPNGGAFNVDTTNGVYIIDAQIYVTNMLGTQAKSIHKQTIGAQVGPGQTVGLFLVGGDQIAVAGTDITWNDSTGFSTTAGGIFVVTLLVEFSPG